MFSTTLVLSLVLTSPLSLPDQAHLAEAADASDRGQVVEVQKTERELDQMGFMERRAAFSLNDNLHPSIANNLLPFFLGGLCSPFGGPLWCPLLFLDDAPNKYFDEALLSWLVWVVPLAGGCLVSFIPYVGWAFSLLWCPVALGISFYLMPVNVANAWDRAAKVHGMKGSGKKASAVPLPDEEAYALADFAMAY